MLTMEVKGFDKFIDKCKTIEQLYPESVNMFMNQETKTLQKNCANASPYATFKKGWYHKTRRDGKIESWKAVKNRAPHLHLVTDGHEIVGHKPLKVRTGKFTKKNDFISQVKKDFEKQFENDMRQFTEGVWN